LKKPFACFSTGKRLDGLVFNLWILEKQLSLGYQDIKTDLRCFDRTKKQLLTPLENR